MVHDPSVADGEATAPHERRERRDAAAHRQRILAVARDLFARHGVGAVTMHAIAVAAGIGQGTLYRRYTNKGDLCRDLLHEHYERFTTELRAYLTEAAAIPPLERLDVALVRTLHFVNESMALLETVVASQMREMQCDGPPRFTRMPPRHESGQMWGHAVIADLLTEAVARGELAPLDVAYTADLLLSAMNPMVLRYQQSERGYSLERIAAGLRHIFITGIQPVASSVQRSKTEE